METILSVLQSIGGIGVVLALLLCAFYVIWKVSKEITIMKNHRNNTEKDVDKINTAIDRLTNEIRTRLTNEIIEVKTDVSFLRKIVTANSTDLTQSHSPISLTEKGKKVAEEMNINSLIAHNWEQIVQYIDNKSVQTAYDIQQLCIDTAIATPELLFTTEDLNAIKNYAFNNGRALASYGSLIGVIIRDRYFAERGISVSDVDKK